jgi:hypothetical protein
LTRRSVSAAVWVYLAEHRSHLNRFIGVRHDLDKGPGYRRRNFCIHLVGRDLDERLIGLNVVAHLLQPSKHRPLGDRLAHLGHGDLDARGARCHSAPQL